MNGDIMNYYGLHWLFLRAVKSLNTFAKLQKKLPVSYLGNFGFPAFDFRLIFCWQTMKSSKKLALPIYFLFIR